MKIEEFYEAYPSLKGLQSSINTQSRAENYEDVEKFLNEVYYIEMITAFDVMNCNIYTKNGWRRIDKVYSKLFNYEKVITEDYVGISVKFMKKVFKDNVEILWKSLKHNFPMYRDYELEDIDYELDGNYFVIKYGCKQTDVRGMSYEEKQLYLDYITKINMYVLFLNERVYSNREINLEDGNLGKIWINYLGMDKVKAIKRYMLYKNKLENKEEVYNIRSLVKYYDALSDNNEEFVYLFSQAQLYVDKFIHTENKCILEINTYSFCGVFFDSLLDREEVLSMLEFIFNKEYAIASFLFYIMKYRENERVLKNEIWMTLALNNKLKKRLYIKENSRYKNTIILEIEKER